MTSETARLVVYIGFAVGLVVWLWGLLRARAMLSGGAESSVELSRVEVDGDAEAVSRELARAITGQGGSMLAGFRVDSVSRDSVRLRGLSSVPFLNRLEVRFALSSVAQDKTEIVLAHNAGALRRAGAVSQALSLGLALPVLLGLAALLLAYAVDAPTVGARGQALQIFQAGHLLWPPFLLQYMGRRTQRLASESLEQVVARLQYR